MKIYTEFYPDEELSFQVGFTDGSGFTAMAGFDNESVARQHEKDLREVWSNVKDFIAPANVEVALWAMNSSLLNTRLQEKK